MLEVNVIGIVCHFFQSSYCHFTNAEVTEPPVKMTLYKTLVALLLCHGYPSTAPMFQSAPDHTLPRRSNKNALSTIFPNH